MSREDMRILVDTDKQGEQEIDFTMRCDMCGMEHEMTSVAEVVRSADQVIVTISVKHPTAMFYGGHST